MTKEQAKSGLMQIYGMLSEEKKKAIDVAVKALQEQADDPYQTDMDDAWEQAKAEAQADKKVRGAIELSRNLAKFTVPNRTQTDGGMQMTNEQAKSELMQIYGFLSEEKKQALDVGIDAIQKIQKIDYIINSPVSIQEDVFRYKMICEVIKE